MFPFWENQDGFATKIKQIHCKPAGLEDQDLKTEPGFGPKIMQIHGPKIMQIHCKQGGLEDKDLKTEPGLSLKFMQIHANTLLTRWFGRPGSEI